MKGMEFSMRHIIDLSDLTVKEFNDLYKLTTNIIDRPEGYVDACRGKVLGSLFYEPSTRTNLSFSTAMMRLGGSVVGFSDRNASPSGPVSFFRVPPRRPRVRRSRTRSTWYPATRT